MSDISPAQTLLVLVSLIPNNNIRYAMLSLGATITVLYDLNLQRPSVRLVHLENGVGHTEDIIREAKLRCPMDHLSLTENEVCLLKVRRSMCILRSALLKISAMGCTSNGFKSFRQLCRDIHQGEKEVKRIKVAVQLTLEAEHQRKYTEDIRETEAIITAVRNPLAQAEMYNQSGAHFHHNSSESYRREKDVADRMGRVLNARLHTGQMWCFSLRRVGDHRRLSAALHFAFGGGSAGRWISVGVSRMAAQL
ncbi:hypothetical protein C8R44DRAFT_723540 [Mycena epipterygia]|nr:hypothetical protein C8R44DRAFT_723540 [Mycena epipterygia]